MNSIDPVSTTAGSPHASPETTSYTTLEGRRVATSSGGAEGGLEPTLMEVGTL